MSRQLTGRQIRRIPVAQGADQDAFARECAAQLAECKAVQAEILTVLESIRNQIGMVLSGQKKKRKRRKAG